MLIDSALTTDFPFDGGHGIAFNPDDGLLYHVVGKPTSPAGRIVFESIALTDPLTLVTSVDLILPPDWASGFTTNRESIKGFEYVGNQQFLGSTSPRQGNTKVITISQVTNTVTTLYPSSSLDPYQESKSVIPLSDPLSEPVIPCNLCFTTPPTPPSPTPPSPTPPSDCDCCDRCSTTKKGAKTTTKKSGGTTGKTTTKGSDGGGVTGTTKQANNLRKRFQEVFAAGSAKGVEEIEALGI